MKFFVEILARVNDTQHLKLVTEYHDLQARSLEEARIRGIERYERENPGKSWDFVYGKARPD